MTSKGTGTGGCCCGACRVVPRDRRLSTQDVQEIQHQCCRCIPLAVCLKVDEGGLDVFSKVLFALCDANTAFDGAPILYTGAFEVRQKVVTINIRYTAYGDECRLTWDIPELSLSGDKLIDHGIAATNPETCAEQKTQSCCEFGHQWIVAADASGGEFTITLTESDTVSVKEAKDCCGCGCICDCVCMSVRTRTEGAGFTYTGDTHLACSEPEITEPATCGGVTIHEKPGLKWVADGWTVRMAGQRDHHVDTATILKGNEIPLACDLFFVLWNGDDVIHQIDDAGDGISVVYDFILDNGKDALEAKWVGRSVDEMSTVEIYAWDWVASEWDLLSFVGGRPAGIDIDQALVIPLEPIHTGSGANEGQVRIKFDVINGSTLKNDLLRLVTGSQCELELVPPYGIPDEPDAWLSEAGWRRSLAFPNNCPDPKAVWEFTIDDTDYLVGWECSWCGGECGDFAPCCNRPLPNLLTASVVLGCPGECGQEVEIILRSTTGAVWEGTGIGCEDAPFHGILTCTGDAVNPSWTFDLTSGLGGCSFSGSASGEDVTCNPLRLAFSGEFGAGIGCCGAAGDPFVFPPINVVVTE